MTTPALDELLQTYVGREAEPPRVARYPVNAAMIRNWIEAHDDFNPVYVDDQAAREAGRDDIICPPAMISTWVMSGYRRYRDVQRLRAQGRSEDFAYSELMNHLDRAGFTSVVATNVEQSYHRDLRPGDHITAHYTIESVSGPKTTALGEGHFITLYKRYLDQSDDLVAEEWFRLLRFRPTAKEGAN
ncbi:MaoC family dehydratase N-terminal domain-containing protein [Mycobacterium sherrisii]|uniref:FAS1-like dehydratase domain-containing protein n=1 Tax=Mycobacterium sherrisii TaxID=243061 RepID=UPI003975DB5E